ncbi:AraC family transcriptional regulator [Vibrio rumoiensis]|uniref:Helix-turn-helix domain-containing protein n=1 Tax=Vibrio rumoiensis TaxID=76258 RepID=A0ABW7IV28_9VIBR
MESIPEYLGHRINVPEQLKSLYSHFYFAENCSNETIKHTFLPSFQVMLIFSMGTPFTIQLKNQESVLVDRYLILGPVKRAFEYQLPPQSDIIVIHFLGDGFYRLFGSGQVDRQFLSSLDEDCLMGMRKFLHHLPDAASRAEYLITVGQSYLRDAPDVNLNFAHNCNQQPQIKRIAEKYGKNIRTVQMQYQKQLGFSAKEYSRYQRFIRAIAYIQSCVERDMLVDWAEVVFECGYYDQSHLIRDFKHYLHLSPSQYLDIQWQVCDVSA